MAARPSDRAIPKPHREDARRRGESSQTGSDRGAKGPRSPDEREKGDARRARGGPGQAKRRSNRKLGRAADT
jgi:hypothetical protein